MNNFQRFTIVVGVIIGATWKNIRGDRQGANEEIFHGFRQLGGVYVKFLQILSLKSRRFSGSWSSEESLAVFDSVRPDQIDIMEILNAQLGPHRLESLTQVDSLPFASGSFGQVYNARHQDGNQVIIKVLRPNLVKHIKLDLRVLRVVASILSLSTPRLATDFRAIFKDFRKVILDEIDYGSEVDHALYFYNYYRNHPQLVIPYTYADLSTSEIIVQQFLPGLSMTDVIRETHSGADPQAFVKQQVGSDLASQMRCLGEELLFTSVIAERILGDPHPGNIKLLDGDRIGLYDFGITGEPPEHKRAYIDLMRDYSSLYHGTYDPGDIFIHGIRFFANNLFRAVYTVASATRFDGDFDLIEELRDLARKSFEQNKDKVDVSKILKNGQISRIMSMTVNEGNKFALRTEFDSSVLVRAADGYMTLLDTLGLRALLVPGIFDVALERIDQSPQEVHGKPDAMEFDTAIDLVSNWIQDMFEKDPILFRSFIRKFRQSVPKESLEASS